MTQLGGIHPDVCRLLGQLYPNLPVIKNDRFLQICMQNNVFVARDDERLGNPVIGMVRLSVDEEFVGTRGFVNDLIVDASYRRRGIATELMTVAHEHANKLGANKLSLSSNRGREEAHALYLKLGYELAPSNIFIIDLSKS